MYNWGEIFDQCHKLKGNLSLNDIEKLSKRIYILIAGFPAIVV